MGTSQAPNEASPPGGAEPNGAEPNGAPRELQETNDTSRGRVARGAATLVVIPTYNEIENVDTIVPAVLAALPEAELVIVDDSSPDGTGARVKALQANEPRLHLIERDGPRGYGPAAIAGLRFALDGSYQRVVQMDADLSHDPAYLPLLCQGARTFHLAIGSRKVPGGGTRNWSLFRRLLSSAGNMYARLLLGLPIHDVTAGFVAYRREVLESIGFEDVPSSGYGFLIELKYRAFRRGFRAIEVPIVFADRVRGDSKMDARIAIEALAQIAKLRWRLRAF